MTEEEWMICTDPDRMFTLLGSDCSERKTRLFQVACARRFWNLLDEPHCRKLVEVGQPLGCVDLIDTPLDSSRKAIEIAERSADEVVSLDEMSALSEAAFRFQFVGEYYCSCYGEHWGTFDGELVASSEAAYTAHEASLHYLSPTGVTWRAGQCAGYLKTTKYGETEAGGDTEERAIHCELIRDIFGNPFRNVTLDPDWMTSTVMAIARGIYDTRTYEVMPILADALQDAGCENTDILEHCRRGGPHVRGCWVIDLILGKE